VLYEFFCDFRPCFYAVTAVQVHLFRSACSVYFYVVLLYTINALYFDAVSLGTEKAVGL